jgi:hypothetical protein
VDEHDYIDTQYGRDFVDWYHGSLVDHGRRILLEANNAFDQSMRSVPLGVKIPGVHWQMKCVEHPRIAEITAGLIRTTLDLSPTAAARVDSYGYKSILEMLQTVKQATGREVILHFTALEMDNDPACPLAPSEGANTSMAEALVFWISQGATDHGLVHKGENALACVGGSEAPGDPDNRSWERIRNVYSNAPYRGFTFLRLVGTGCGWQFDKDHYASFIAEFVQPQ